MSTMVQSCKPCEKSVKPLKGQTLVPYQEQMGEGWKIVEEHHLEKHFFVKNFQEALALTHSFGIIAEEEGHHPDIYLSWGRVLVLIWTHKINGLSENDFILANRCDEVWASFDAKSACF